MGDARQICGAVAITAVWRALGGGELRRGRGRAFWRDGDGLNISLSDTKGTWYDHRDGIGGGVLDLVLHVRGGNRQGALRWLADSFGLPLEDRPLTPAERRQYSRDAKLTEDAQHFAVAARLMAEWALEELPPMDPERRVHTELLKALRTTPVTEYCAWLGLQPAWAAALVKAGRERSSRLQVALARYLVAEGHRVA